jgi:hypothetical protein
MFHCLELDVKESSMSISGADKFRIGDETYSNNYSNGHEAKRGLSKRQKWESH